ncbi:Segregation and condensation protein A [uncultured archaeon]|nr:Segregation and condensation protein A [uncultured archaeon]
MSYLERIVVKPTWKQLLLELIDQNKIDPWDVDIVKLSDEFMVQVKEMQRLDLGLHANVILAAAILLKYKSDYLKYFTAPPVTEIPPLPEDNSFSEIPQLSLVARIPPKRQITLDELMGEMERVIKYETGEIRRMPKGTITEFVDLHIKGDDIDKRMELVLGRVKDNMDETGFATFSSLLQEHNTLEVVYTLLSLLHLHQKRSVNIHQEKLFGEILICILDGEIKNTGPQFPSEDPAPEVVVAVTSRENENEEKKEKIKITN